MGSLCWLFIKKKQERLLITIAVLLVARIALNWFVLPERYVIDWGTPVKESSIKVGKEFKGKPLFIFSKTLMQPTNGFYITREREDIFRYKETVDSPAELFIVDPFHVKRNFEYNIKGELKVRYKELTFDVADNVRKK